MLKRVLYAPPGGEATDRAVPCKAANVVDPTVFSIPAPGPPAVLKFLNMNTDSDINFKSIVMLTCHFH